MFIRSLLFAFFMWLSILIIVPLSLLTLPFSFQTRYRFISQWARINLWWLKTICKLHYQVTGLENIPVGNAIILCKHQSAWETLALQQIFPPQVWLLKKELLWIPFFGWGLAMLEPIAIDRKAGRKSLRQLREQGTKRLIKGRWVVIFPEGTRVAPGQKGHYAPGGAMLAANTGYPIVPVAHNAGEYWPKHGFLKRPGVIKVVIGPLIVTAGRKAAEINAEAEKWIEDTMRQVTDQEYKS